MIWYWGSTSSCLGTISTDRNSANSTSRPRNSSRANAYAPSEQNASWPIVTAPATTSEFTSCVPNGMVAKTSAKFDHSHSRGSRVGGTVAVSGCDLSAVSTCQTNGPIIATEPATSTAWVATEPSSDPRALRGARRRSDIVDPPALQPELDEREGADQQHEQEGQRGGRALVRLDEGLLVEQRDDRLRRAERRVRGGRRAHDVDEVEDLQRRDDVDDGAEEDRRAEHRQRESPEPLPGVRAVDLRGLPVLLRDRLDARDEDHQVVADLGPDLDDADREQRRVGVGHPVRAGDPEDLEDLVEQPEVAVVEPLPHQAARHRQRDERDEEERAVDRDAAQALAVEQHREQDRDRQREQPDHHVEQGVAERGPERLELEDGRVVVQPGEGVAAERAPLGEAQRERRDRRVEVEDQQAQPDRGDEQVGAAVGAPRPARRLRGRRAHRGRG